MPYLSGIYLLVFLVRGRGAENIEKKKKADRKNIEKGRERKRKIQLKKININKHLWFYLLYKNYILLENIV